MDLETLKSLLEGNENQETIINAFAENLSTINDLTNKKSAGSIKANEKLRSYEDALKELGKDDTTDIRDFVSSFKEKTNKAVKSEVANASLVEKIEDLEKKWAMAEQKAKDLETKSTRERLSNKLNESLSDKIYGSKYVVESLINNGRVREIEGDIVFVDGDTYTNFEKGLENVIRENEDIKRVSQKSGSDSMSKVHSRQKDLSNMSVTDVINNVDSIAKELGISI